MFSVELPYSSEVRFFSHQQLAFMREYNVVFGKKLRNHFSHVFPFLLECLSSLWCGGVNTEEQVLFLVGMSERVDSFIGVIKMPSVSDPSWVRLLVVEKS